ncbi:MAG TPA: hypothetical protein VM864_12635 [Pyrinomonadaceae bacterium]|jgi:hypothetical protein|nr:hypothetical protein [Pyrinomonadaceae bacterium]
MILKRQLRRAASVALLTACVVDPTMLGATRPRPPRARTKAKAARVVDALKPACQKPSYPSPSPAAALGIDAQCGLNGSGTGAEGQQDSVKNNFCATGTPKAMTIPALTSLQAQVEKNGSINFGNENKGGKKKGPTTNRAPLRKLGEGKLVTLRAFVLIARQEGGESVNCGKNVPDQPLFHDIHISLVSTADATDECSGVVAEMSPHHRPDSWTHANVEKVSRAKLPVRVTGQLYFDSSHFPCSGGQGAGEGNPKRVSLWEIHPIYKFEVCTAGCDGAGTWLPLDEWAKQQ